jgi:hypothetical protein
MVGQHSKLQTEGLQELSCINAVVFLVASDGATAGSRSKARCVTHNVASTHDRCKSGLKNQTNVLSGIRKNLSTCA